MKYSIAAIVFLLAGSCQLSEPVITEWRGVDRKGIYHETGLLTEWPEDGPKELWFVEGLGNGYGSPTVTGEHIYITGEIDSMAVLHCFDMEGNPKWQTVLGKEWIQSFPGSRSAPTVVDELIYVGTGMGDLYCIEAEDGTVLWSREFADDFQGVYPLHGHSEASVVLDDRVFWTPGGKEYNVVALDRFSGSLIWSSAALGERSAYNPSQLVKLDSRELFITFSSYHLLAFDAESGVLLWSQGQYEGPLVEKAIGYNDTHANSVIYEDGKLYYAAGDGNCGVKLALSDDGTEITELWRNAEFTSFFGGFVKLDNQLYGPGTRYLLSVNSESGASSDSLKIGTGAIIAADQMLYYYNQKGEMNLVRPDAGKMELVSSFKIHRGSRHHFSHPVIKAGILYQRRGDALMAFDLRGT